MQPRPAHLGERYANQFCDPSVVAAYPFRPPYPPAVFPLLLDLIAGPSCAVLDIGCGTGDLARGLAPLVERVDAVDMSASMLALGRTLPGGAHARLRWLLGRIEEVVLDPPYGLVTAGESLHWMAWDIVLPRLRGLLAPGGVVAIVGRRAAYPWHDAELALIARYSTNREFRPYNLVEELVRRGLFAPAGTRETEPVIVRQPVAAYVESMHSRNGFSRDQMDPLSAVAFDQELAGLITPFAGGGEVGLSLAAVIDWGMPAPGALPEASQPPVGETGTSTETTPGGD